MARHGGGHQALHEFLAPGVDDGEAHAPDGAAHEVHTEQSGDEEVDVARTCFVHQAVRGGYRICTAGGSLDGLVGQQPGGTAFGVLIVVAVNDAALR